MRLDLHTIPGDFEVIRCDLPAFVGDFAQMDYGDPQAPRTAQVREEYRLDEVIAGHASEFAAQRALKRWVRSRWDHGWSLSFERVQDALDILREAERGEHFNCGFYNRVFVECARALGWVARPVAIGVQDVGFPRGLNVGNVGHSVPEIWSNEFRKWVILDPDLNVHYERDGLPLSALEIHDAWLSHHAGAVEMVQEHPAFTTPAGEHCRLVPQLMPEMEHFDEHAAAAICGRFVRHNALDYYARVSIGRWTWLDRRCLPSFVTHFGPSVLGVLTSNADDLYWTVNMARLSARSSWSDGARLEVTLEHCMPWFSHYEARIDGGQWAAVAEAFDWPMREGRNVLEVRPVNVCGRTGIPSRVEVAYAPAKW